MSAAGQEAPVRWLDPTLPGPWEAVYLDGEGWTVLAPWTGEGAARCRPHVAECGHDRAAAEQIAAWCPVGRVAALEAERSAAKSRAAGAVARCAVLEGHVRALLDEAYTAPHFALAPMEAARAAITPAERKCEACRGRGCTEGSTRHGSGDHDTCPACSGTGRAPGETAREVLRGALMSVWVRGMGGEGMSDEAHVETEIGAAADRILARLAALAPPTAEAEALLLCRRAVEVGETYFVHAYRTKHGDLHLCPGGHACQKGLSLQEIWRNAHTAAVAALKALEGRTK